MSQQVRQRVYDADSILSIFGKEGENVQKVQFSSILLNKIDKLEILPEIIEKSQSIILADGATNYYRKIQEKDKISRLPDYISGDLESITQENLLYYQQKGVQIYEDEDQNYSDFMKSFKCLYDQVLFKQQSSNNNNNDNSTKEHNIVFVGGLTGRLDHLFNNLSYMQGISSDLDKIGYSGKVYMLNEENLIFYVLPGHNLIKVASPFIIRSSTGIIPFREIKSNVTTSGFKWNLSPDNPFTNDFYFGNKVSSSNEIIDDVIHIETDYPLLVTLEINLNKI